MSHTPAHIPLTNPLASLGKSQAGGPFYPLLTGRRDSDQSFFERAMADIPRPDGNISETLRLFGLRGFNERETVALLGGHSIGTIGCEFIKPRLDNFLGTGKPDPTIPPEFAEELRLNCMDMAGVLRREPGRGAVAGGMMSYYNQKGLPSSMSSSAAFDGHYYQSLVRGRGLLFADQQLMADERTANHVRLYSADAPKFRVDFARTMLKMSSLLSPSPAHRHVRLACSFPPPENSTLPHAVTEAN